MVEEIRMIFFKILQINGSSPSLLVAFDSVLEGDPFFEPCRFNLNTKNYGKPFTLNIKTMERDYGLVGEKVNLCHHSGKK